MTKLFTTYAINNCPIYEQPHMTIQHHTHRTGQPNL